MMEQNSKTLKEYIGLLKRRRYVIVIPMMLLLALTGIAVIILPAIYRSEATILIEQQHIPSDLVKSTVVSFADERIKQIQQKLMTIDNIIRIIDQFNLYQKQKQKKMADTELAELFSENVELNLQNADVVSNGKTSKATLAFKLAFNDHDPIIAQKVANQLVTLFLDENIKSRNERAGETTSFLRDESEKLRREIQKLESQLAEFKERYSDSLPELLNINISSLSRLELEIQQLGMQEKMVAERRNALRNQLAVTSSSVQTVDNKTKDTDISLDELEAEYNSLLTKYSERHPRIQALKRKIESYDKSKKTTLKKQGAEAISNPIYLQIQSDIELADTEAKNIATERNTLNQKISKLESNIAKSHQVERGYGDLMRELENKKSKYTELSAKLSAAKLSQTLEEEQKGEKFTLLEPPRTPEKPLKPNRIKLLLMGFMISILGGLGFGFAFDSLDGSVRGQRQLSAIAGFEPLVVIPYIETEEDISYRQKLAAKFAILGMSLIIGFFVSVHFLYMPLDLILQKLIDTVSRF